VLPIGSDRFLGLKVEGCDVFVRVDKLARHVPGERVSFAFIPERLHLFDKASGASLLVHGA
jgi:multiple sugar transport system ATP-binding protein